MALMKKTLITFFQARKGIVAVYLFGSQAKQKSHGGSDVDIAVLYEEDKVPDFRNQLELRDTLSGILRKEVDLVFLNRANPILKHQILKYGALLLNHHPSLVNRFFVRTLMEYDDIQRIRVPIEKNILKRRLYG